MTRGWVLNEIFRRADPQGRTIGEYLRTEIAGPLHADVHMGLTSQTDLDRVSDVKSWSLSYVLGQTMLPYALGSKVNLNLLEFLGGGVTLWRASKKNEAELKAKGIEKPVSYTHLTLPTTPYV